MIEVDILDSDNLCLFNQLQICNNPFLSTAEIPNLMYIEHVPKILANTCILSMIIFFLSLDMENRFFHL